MRPAWVIPSVEHNSPCGGPYTTARRTLEHAPPPQQQVLRRALLVQRHPRSPRGAHRFRCRRGLRGAAGGGGGGAVRLGQVHNFPFEILGGRRLLHRVRQSPADKGPPCGYTISTAEGYASAGCRRFPSPLPRICPFISAPWYSTSREVSLTLTATSRARAPAGSSTCVVFSKKKHVTRRRRHRERAGFFLHEGSGWIPGGNRWCPECRAGQGGAGGTDEEMGGEVTAFWVEATHRHGYLLGRLAPEKAGGGAPVSCEGLCEGKQRSGIRVSCGAEEMS